MRKVDDDRQGLPGVHRHMEWVAIEVHAIDEGLKACLAIESVEHGEAEEVGLQEFMWTDGVHDLVCPPVDVVHAHVFRVVQVCRNVESQLYRNTLWMRSNDMVEDVVWQFLDLDQLQAAIPWCRLSSVATWALASAIPWRPLSSVATWALASAIPWRPLSSIATWALARLSLDPSLDHLVDCGLRISTGPALSRPLLAALGT